MIELTQTELAPGNCYQTAAACLLGVPAEQLPDQTGLQRRNIRCYDTILDCYLWRHHKLELVYLHGPALIGLLEPREPIYHLVEGTTVRTERAGGTQHCCVGRNGKLVWDPHPSRAGLTQTLRWAFLVKPDATAAKLVEAEIAAAIADPWKCSKDGNHWRYFCQCPACLAERRSAEFPGGPPASDVTTSPLASGDER